MRRPFVIAYTFVLMNWAAVVGLYHFLCGHKDIWDTQRTSHAGRLGESNS